MSKNWDYSQLSHLASEEGGPQKFIDKVASINYQRGIEAERGTEGWKGALLVGGAIGLWEGGKEIVKRIKKHRAAKREALLQEATLARERYLQGMATEAAQEAQKENQDNQETERGTTE